MQHSFILQAQLTCMSVVLGQGLLLWWSLLQAEAATARCVACGHIVLLATCPAGCLVRSVPRLEGLIRACGAHTAAKRRSFARGQLLLQQLLALWVAGCNLQPRRAQEAVSWPSLAPQALWCCSQPRKVSWQCGDMEWFHATKAICNESNRTPLAAFQWVCESL